MGYFAYIELDIHTEISISDENGANVGNPIATFYIVYLKSLFNNNDFFESDWFNRFEQLSNFNLRILPLIMYAYDGHITEEEKLSLQKLLQFKEVKEKEEIIERLEIENKWEDISKILIIAKEYNRILPLMGIDTYWFSKENTIPAFISLQIAIEKGISEGAKFARIHLS